MTSNRRSNTNDQHKKIERLTFDEWKEQMLSTNLIKELSQLSEGKKTDTETKKTFLKNLQQAIERTTSPAPFMDVDIVGGRVKTLLYIDISTRAALTILIATLGLLLYLLHIVPTQELIAFMHSLISLIPR